MAGGQTDRDANYPLAHPAIQSLIQQMAGRGHEIGFHPSYLAAEQSPLFMKEYNKLQRHSPLPLRGGRHHFMRFQAPRTWRLWAQAGLTYDSSLCYADHPGFRAGICYPYTVFDLEHRRPLPLIERPPILMEYSILGDRYLNVSDPRKAVTIMQELKALCRQFKGQFVFLWHNSRLTTASEKAMFADLLRTA
jgi:hypothetical protein